MLHGKDRDADKIVTATRAVPIKRKASVVAIGHYVGGHIKRVKAWHDRHPEGRLLHTAMVDLAADGLVLPSRTLIEKAVTPLLGVCPTCKAGRHKAGAEGWTYCTPDSQVLPGNGWQAFCPGCIGSGGPDGFLTAEQQWALMQESEHYLEYLATVCNPGTWSLTWHATTSRHDICRINITRDAAAVVRRYTRGGCLGSWQLEYDDLEQTFIPMHFECNKTGVPGYERLIEGVHSRWTFSRAGGQCLRCATWVSDATGLNAMQAERTEKTKLRMVCESMLFASVLTRRPGHVVAPTDARGYGLPWVNWHSKQVEYTQEPEGWLQRFWP